MRLTLRPTRRPVWLAAGAAAVAGTVAVGGMAVAAPRPGGTSGGVPGAAVPDRRPCVTAADATMRAGDWTSASSVAALGRDLSSVVPRIGGTGPGSLPERLLRPVGPQGHFGPLGPWGPLGADGPLGRDSAAYERWLGLMRADPFLGPLARGLESSSGAGALGPAGPLGPRGPLGADAYCAALPGVTAAAEQLQAGGVFGALGPAGPLGPYGPLGPLGPRGPYGAHLDPGTGTYVKDGVTVREVTAAVPWSATARGRYPLVEAYPEGKAPRTGLDTSFTAAGSARPGAAERYRITSGRAQFVTVLVVPEGGFESLAGMLAGPLPALGHPANAGAVDYPDVLVWGSRLPPADRIADTYRLTVGDATGRVIARSRTRGFAGWVQVRAPAAARLTVGLTLETAWDGRTGPRGYRLVVTGGSEWLSATDISGDHVVSG